MARTEHKYCSERMQDLRQSFNVLAARETVGNIIESPLLPPSNGNHSPMFFPAFGDSRPSADRGHVLTCLEPAVKALAHGFLSLRRRTQR